MSYPMPRNYTYISVEVPVARRPEPLSLNPVHGSLKLQPRNSDDTSISIKIG